MVASSIFTNVKRKQMYRMTFTEVVGKSASVRSQSRTESWVVNSECSLCSPTPACELCPLAARG